MTEYTICKHETDGVIILDDNFLSMIAYFEWADSIGVFGTREICWECFCKNKFKLKELK